VDTGGRGEEGRLEREEVRRAITLEGSAGPENPRVMEKGDFP